MPGVQDEEHADSKLLWYLELLSEMVRCDGKALLKYKDMLKEIIHLTIHLKCKKAYSRAGKVNICFNLCFHSIAKPCLIWVLILGKMVVEFDRSCKRTTVSQWQSNFLTMGFIF